MSERVISIRSSSTETDEFTSDDVIIDVDENRKKNFHITDCVRKVIVFVVFILVIVFIIGICLNMKLSTHENNLSSELSNENVPVQPFGSNAYECSGSCYCDNPSDRRNSMLVSRGFSHIVLCLTSVMAIKVARVVMEEKCVSEFESYECANDHIKGEIDECLLLPQQDEEYKEDVKNQDDLLMNSKNWINNYEYDEIDEFFLDGNNMFYMTECMKRLQPWTESGRTRVACILTEAVEKCMEQSRRGKSITHLFFDGSQNPRDLMREEDDPLQIHIAWPKFTNSDDFIVDMVRSRKGDGSKFVVVTSDRELIRRLKKNKRYIWIEHPQGWLEKCVSFLTGKKKVSEKEMDDFCLDICRIV